MDTATPDRHTATNHKTSQSAPAVAEAGPAIAAGSPWPGAFEAIGMAFTQIKKNPQPALVMLAVYVAFGIVDILVSGGNEAITRSTSSVQSNSGSNYTAIGGLIFLLAGPIYALAIADRKKISLSEFFVFDVSKYFSIFFAFILMMLLVIPAVLTVGIALIWFIPWFAFVIYIIADTGVGPFKAFGQSKALGSQNKGKVWGIAGATLVLFIPAIALVFIPTVGILLGTVYDGIISILTGGAMAILYRWIQQNQSVAVDTDA